MEEAIQELHSIAKIGEENDEHLAHKNKGKYDPPEQLEIYEARYNELNKKYLKVIEENNSLNSTKIGVQEILRERDGRIQRLNNNFEELTSNNFWV